MKLLDPPMVQEIGKPLFEQPIWRRVHGHCLVDCSDVRIPKPLTERSEYTLDLKAWCFTNFNIVWSNIIQEMVDYSAVKVHRAKEERLHFISEAPRMHGLRVGRNITTDLMPSPVIWGACLSLSSRHRKAQIIQFIPGA